MTLFIETNSSETTTVDVVKDGVVVYYSRYLNNILTSGSDYEDTLKELELLSNMTIVFNASHEYEYFFE